MARGNGKGQKFRNLTMHCSTCFGKVPLGPKLRAMPEPSFDGKFYCAQCWKDTKGLERYQAHKTLIAMTEVAAMDFFDDHFPGWEAKDEAEGRDVMGKLPVQ